MDRIYKSYLGWKSWLGAGEGVGFELLMIMREARNRKSSNSCWISDGPEGKSHILTLHIGLLNLINLQNLFNRCRCVCMDICVCSPRCSFSLPQSESKVLMRRRCPAKRMLSASLVSISELQLGSKLSSQEISSSSMVAALTFTTSISEAGGGGERTRGRKKHWDLMAESGGYNLSIQSILVSGTILHIQVLIMWEKREFIGLLVRSSRSWHLRSKYSVHCDRNLRRKSKINTRPLLQFQSCISSVFLAELPLVDPSHYRRRTP